MKYIIFAGLIFFSLGSLASNAKVKGDESLDKMLKEIAAEQAKRNPIHTEDDFIKAAIKNGYQVQRNLAFGYQTGDSKTGGYDFISKNDTKSCAWRKILLIANPEKTDSSDTANERFSCRNLDFEQDEEVWKIVYKYLPMIAEAKEKGEYMVEKKSEPTPDKLEIIDVTQ
ncbi:hypothetical protein [Citrobacter amalonaticus]|uniref:Uncharacterized protein n=1 Tax=Citrobacter amalonaticus TaxID=35703 RepID=A0AAX2BED2_CITAM|nr:hypothetical protein [Citrobacter amalonaticus]SAZ04913.1 conserved exported protein of unknown function [Citrobacter amalonaticus]HEM7399231.1 hypothetical protein [Citrobacter farmeri]